MHAEMGMNLIRVWGGGFKPRPEFYDAADELGVLVMQEFWMTETITGDGPAASVGPWTTPRAWNPCGILSGSPKSSGCFWCGGNELYPASKSPLLT